MKLKDNENLIVLGLFLGAVGLLSALVLALVSYVTAKPIADAKAAQQRKAMSQVLPAFDNDPSQLVFETVTPSKWQVKFMGAKKDGKLVAVAAAAVNPNGYGGDIEMLMGCTDRITKGKSKQFKELLELLRVCLYGIIDCHFAPPRRSFIWNSGVDLSHPPHRLAKFPRTLYRW